MSLSSKILLLLLILYFSSKPGGAQNLPFPKLNSDKIGYAREVEQEALVKKDSVLLAEGYYLYGKAYAFANDYITSQRFFLNSLRILKPRGDSFNVARLYVRLSTNEKGQGHLKEAFYYSQLANQVAQHIKSDKAMLLSYSALGQLHEYIQDKDSQRNQNKFDSAQYYYDKVNNLAMRLKDTLGMAEANQRLGALLIKHKDERSISYLKNALSLFTLRDNPGDVIRSMLILSSAYLTFNEPRLAYENLRLAESYNHKQNLNEFITRLDLEKGFINYYQYTGQWKQAMDRMELLHSLEKSQFLADRNNVIERLNAEHEARQKETVMKAQKEQLDISNRSNEFQQRFVVTFCFLFILAAVMSYVFFLLFRKNQRISTINAMLVKEQNHRIKNHLHMVASLLNMQSRRMSEGSAKNALTQSHLRVQSISLLQRQFYNENGMTEINLNEYIVELVESVLNACGYSHIETELKIDNVKLEADKAISLGLILNELITNACKYAFPFVADPCLYVSCVEQNGRLKIQVGDNGPGFIKPNTIIDGDMSVGKTESFGMQLIKMQADQLNAKLVFDNRYTEKFSAQTDSDLKLNKHRSKMAESGNAQNTLSKRIADLETGAVITLEFNI